MDTTWLYSLILAIIGGIVVNFLIGKRNNEEVMRELHEVRNTQKDCKDCFGKLVESSIRQEALLGSVVNELQKIRNGGSK